MRSEAAAINCRLVGNNADKTSVSGKNYGITTAAANCNRFNK